MVQGDLLFVLVNPAWVILYSKVGCEKKRLSPDC